MKMNYIKKLTDVELEKEYKELKDIVYNIGCYGVTDLNTLTVMQLEREERGLVESE